jgi:hypothetical protein
MKNLLLENVTAARTVSMNATTPLALAKAEEGLTSSIEVAFCGI